MKKNKNLGFIYDRHKSRFRFFDGFGIPSRMSDFRHNHPKVTNDFRDSGSQCRGLGALPTTTGSPRGLRLFIEFFIGVPTGSSAASARQAGQATGRAQVRIQIIS